MSNTDNNCLENGPITHHLQQLQQLQQIRADSIYFASRIIDALGGTCAVAKLCGVAPPHVSSWRKTGIPKKRLDFLISARPFVFKRLQEALQRESITTNEIDLV